MLNARIEELILSSGTTGKPQVWFTRPEMEKFAELIVRECATFSRQHNLENADRSYMIHTAMKEHFGVEE